MAAVDFNSVVPADIVRTAMNEKFGGIQTWFAAVNGVALPNINLRFSLQDLDYARVRQSMLTRPLASYPIDQGPHYVEFDLPTYQPDLESMLTGATLRAKAATNTARTVGILAGLPSGVETSRGEWFCLKVTADAAEIPRVDFPGINTDSAVIVIYDPSDESVTELSALDTTPGVMTPINPWIGNLALSDLDTAPTFTYNSLSRPQVIFGADTLTIDYAHIDPALETGDEAVIVGIAYTFRQVVNDNDLSILRDPFKEHDICLDAWMPLGRSPISNRWVHRHIRKARLSNPGVYAAETSGENTTPNMRTLRYEIDHFAPQNAAAGLLSSDLYDDTLIHMPV